MDPSDQKVTIKIVPDSGCGLPLREDSVIPQPPQPRQPIRSAVPIFPDTHSSLGKRVREVNDAEHGQYASAHARGGSSQRPRLAPIGELWNDAGLAASIERDELSHAHPVNGRRPPSLELIQDSQTPVRNTDAFIVPEEPKSESPDPQMTFHDIASTTTSEVEILKTAAIAQNWPSMVSQRQLIMDQQAGDTGQNSRDRRSSSLRSAQFVTLHTIAGASDPGTSRKEVPRAVSDLPSPVPTFHAKTSFETLPQAMITPESDGKVNGDVGIQEVLRSRPAREVSTGPSTKGVSSRFRSCVTKGSTWSVPSSGDEEVEDSQKFPSWANKWPR